MRVSEIKRGKMVLFAACLTKGRHFFVTFNTRNKVNFIINGLKDFYDIKYRILEKLIFGL